MTARLGLASGLLLLLCASCSGGNFDVAAESADAGGDATADSAGDAKVDDTSPVTEDSASPDSGAADSSATDSSPVPDTAVVDVGVDSGCGPADTGILWVDQGAKVTGSGTPLCPFKTITAATTFAKSASFKGIIRVKAPPTGAYVYNEPEAVAVPEGVTLAGDDELRVQIVANGTCANSATTLFFCAVMLAPGSKLEKVTIAPVTDKSFDFGVVTTYVAAGARPVLNYVTITGSKRSGVAVMNGAELHSVNSTKNTESGVACAAGQLLLDDGGAGGRASKLDENGQQGVLLAGPATATLVNVSLQKNSAEGLRAEAGGPARAIGLRNVTASLNKASGVEVQSGNVTIEGGTFDKNNSSGLRVTGSTSVTAVNAQFNENTTHGLELQCNVGQNHLLQGVLADSNLANGMTWGGASITINSSKLRPSSFSKNSNSGIRQIQHGTFTLDGALASNNSVAGLVFGAGTVGSGSYPVSLSGLTASGNGGTVLGTGISVGANARAAFKLRGSKLIGNNGGGLLFDYGLGGANTLDLGTTTLPGCNDFGSSKNGKTAMCLVNTGATGSVIAEGNLWSGVLPTTPSAWQLGMTSDCYSNLSYFEVTYRKSSVGANDPVAQPTVGVMGCPTTTTPG